MEKFSPEVSVIIPLYNAEKFLGVCLESLLIQTFTDFEVIVVDDCSTDSSVAIAKSYVERFGGRLKIVKLEKNTGSGSVPRNVGLEHARGEYVYFVDDDDLLVDTALETLYNFAQSYRADVVYMDRGFTCGMEVIPQNLVESAWNPPQFLSDKLTFESDDIAERVERFLQLAFGMPPWTKFLRRDFLLANDIRLPEVKISDDLIWTFEIICLAKKILRVPSELYIYRTTAQSVMNRKRTPEQELRHWINPIIVGVDCLNDFMNGIELFNRQDNLRLFVLNFFAKIQFDFMAKAFNSLNRHEAYKIFCEELAKSKGDHTALTAFLLVLTNMYRSELKK